MTEQKILQYAFEGAQQKLYDERETLHVYKKALSENGPRLTTETKLRLEDLIMEQEKIVEQSHRDYKAISDLQILYEKGGIGICLTLN